MSITLADLLTEADEEARRPRRRYPVVRSGDRAPIPWLVRASIYQRDGHRCRFCGWAPDDKRSGLDLDHMLPWSAGGSDASSNLRTLCSRCNLRRSNWFDDDHHPNVRPTTWWCMSCWRHPALDPDEPNYCDDEEPPRVFRRVWRDGTNLNAVPYVTGRVTQVYCAWCWGYDWTDLAFDERNQAALAALCQTREAA